jgi:hypothetical protein
MIVVKNHPLPGTLPSNVKFSFLTPGGHASVRVDVLNGATANAGSERRRKDVLACIEAEVKSPPCVEHYRYLVVTLQCIRQKFRIFESVMPWR